VIVVTVELKSGIHPSRDKKLGQLVICNDGTGGQTIGNYDARFTGPTGRAGKRGRIERYPRQALAVWNLIRRACEAAGYTS
jgi:hypothetical protein